MFTFSTLLPYHEVIYNSFCSVHTCKYCADSNVTHLVVRVQIQQSATIHRLSAVV